MLNEVTRIFQGQTLEDMGGALVSRFSFYSRGFRQRLTAILFTKLNHHQNGLKLAYDHSTSANDCPITTLNQQLISDLAELRESTTIIDHDPAGRAQYRLTRPFFKAEALLPWPPICPPTPLRYDFYSDGLSEESSSPSLSVASQPSEIANQNRYVAVAESPSLLCDLVPRFNRRSPVFQSKAPSPARKAMSHIIGEDDPFNPFSHDLIFEDKYTRSIDTLDGKIFAPMPKLPITAALANFEVIALEAVLPAAKSVIKTDPTSNNETAFSDDETSSLLSFSTDSAPLLKESRQAPAMARIHQPDTDVGEILYQTGPKPQVQVKLVDDMISFLSLESGPHKSEKMRQLWLPYSHDAARSSSIDLASEMTEDEISEVFSL
ncbi:hypothetical protein C0992_000938 [Termitomyces sp. T32_za158]|nr:hypothetical protein C0992_000938 [Termitomyces sp. T32_za158]